jgi:indolepyruvate ferredoxin oxidoreductase
VQEIVDYGLYGWAMSGTRTWVALVDARRSIHRRDRRQPGNVNIVIPQISRCRKAGQYPPARHHSGQESGCDHKRDAMLAFVRANKLNTYHIGGAGRGSASSPSASSPPTRQRSTSSVSTNALQ